MSSHLKNNEEKKKSSILNPTIETLSASVRIDDYAENVLGFKIESHSRNLLRLVEHDSCIIYPDTNSYYRFSTERGGNIYEFVMEFQDVDFPTALKHVKNYYNDYKPELVAPGTINHRPKEEKELTLPDRATTNNQAINYLTQERGLSNELVQSLVKKNYIYQDYRNNVVFLGYENNRPAYASLRSTFADFKGDIYGSRKEVGFFISNDSDTLVLSESPIDTLSLLDMQENKTNHLGVGGIGGSISCFQYFVENNPKAKTTKNIVIAFDNDKRGIEASERLKLFIDEFYYGFEVSIISPKNKDFNLDLIEQKKEMEKKKEMKKYSFDSIEPFDSNFHENIYKLNSNIDDSVYAVVLPKNLDTIDNIQIYKLDPTKDQSSLYMNGIPLNPFETKEIADFLNNNEELNITLPQHLLNRLETNLHEDAPFFLDSVEKMKGSDNGKDYDFTRYNVKRGSKEYSLNIDNLNDSVGGDVVKHGGWYDLIATEKKEILDYLIKYELSLEPISNENKLMVNKELLEENSPELLFTDVHLEKNKREEFEIPKEFSFFKSPNDSSFIELEATIRYEDKLLLFTANGFEFATAEFNDYNIDDDAIYNILKNNSDDLTDLQDEILYDIEMQFDELKTLEINNKPVAYQNESNVWLEQGVFSLDDKDIENKYVDLMNKNPGKYKFTDDAFKEHFETIQSELLEDLENSAIKDQQEEEYFSDSYGDNYDAIKDEVISLIKKHELGEATTWQNVLQIYLDQQVSWNNMNEFANHFFREIGANITTPITSLSFDENRSTLNVYLDDELSDEEYLSIINFNLLPNEKLLFSDDSVTLKKEDGNHITAENLKTLYEDAGFKQALISDFKLLGLTELQHSSLFNDNPSLFAKIINSDDSYERAFAEATKERDLDNDGIPDRIDIDDTRSTVQSIEDMSDEPKKSRGTSL